MAGARDKPYARCGLSRTRHVVVGILPPHAAEQGGSQPPDRVHREDFVRRTLRLVLAFACLSASAQAAYQWPDSGSPPDLWRTADEACSLGEALPELARLRAVNPSLQYTLIWAYANEYTDGESQCRFVIEEQRPFIATDLFYDFLHIRTGAADACALAGYLDPETGQCGAPKGAFGPHCPAGANGTNPIHGASGNKYQREVDFDGAGSFPLRFERHYNSRDFTATALGSGT